MAHDYKTLMERLEALPSCTLLTTGRTGSDLLQSLLDSHPEVLAFNGHLMFLGANSFSASSAVEFLIPWWTRTAARA